MGEGNVRPIPAEWHLADIELDFAVVLMRSSSGYDGQYRTGQGLNCEAQDYDPGPPQQPSNVEIFQTFLEHDVTRNRAD